MGLCEDRVCIVTGGGRGIGREHALLLARHGAQVVVNDLGTGPDGNGRSAGPAQDVVDEIVGFGGEAVANTDDVSDTQAANHLIQLAVNTFGALHVLVNNAGILRDRMLTNMTDEEWDAVVTVNLRGTFAPSRAAAVYWRGRAKAGEPVDGRLINTSSPSGIYCNAGQANYGAAKAGVAALTVIAARELGRYGVTANGIAPAALTRLTAALVGGEDDDELTRQLMSPEWIAPIVTWLASRESAHVTGRIFEVSGQHLAVAEGWHRGPAVTPITDPELLGPVVKELLAIARPNADLFGHDEKT